MELHHVIAHAAKNAQTPVAQRELAKIREILASPRPGPMDWAHLLKMREESGEQLSHAQRDAWRAALGVS